MTLFYLMILSIVQGITEFLPISSHAHLILLHELEAVPNQDALALDIAVHLGSIVAVCLYFRTEVGRVLTGIGRMARGDLANSEAFLALALGIATVPALVLGAILALTGWIDVLRNITIIGWTMILFGILLWWAHRAFPEARHDGEWRLKDAVIMGLWQAVALIPGVSRSGITMTSARMLGFERHAAARLSMLMSIPITLATGAFLALEVAQNPLSTGLLWQAAVGAVLAFVSAYAALALMMRFLSTVSFTPYILYRLVLGVILLGIAYS